MGELKVEYVEIGKLLLSLKHPEMPKEKPTFTLHVEGGESWSWADIKSNWSFSIDNPPESKPFNEISRDLHKSIGDRDND